MAESVSAHMRITRKRDVDSVTVRSVLHVTTPRRFGDRPGSITAELDSSWGGVESRMGGSSEARDTCRWGRGEDHTRDPVRPGGPLFVVEARSSNVPENVTGDRMDLTAIPTSADGTTFPVVDESPRLKQLAQP